MSEIMSLPVGLIWGYQGDPLPNGWLPCDGRAVSRSAFPVLFAAIGTAYGASEGASTFNLPDAARIGADPPEGVRIVILAKPRALP